MWAPSPRPGRRPCVRNRYDGNRFVEHEPDDGHSSEGGSRAGRLTAIEAADAAGRFRRSMGIAIGIRW